MPDIQRQFEYFWNLFSQRYALPAEQSADIFQLLLTAYSEPQRYYHTVRHIVECLQLFHEIKEQLRNAPAVELALWFHDAVYDPQSAQNEENSALLMRQSCAGIFPDAVLDKASDWICATQLHAQTDDADLQFLLDIDLAILAANADRFNRYESEIRKEYSWVDQTAYQSGRLKVMTAFSQTERLYQSAYFHRKYEQRAKQNLAPYLKNFIT